MKLEIHRGQMFVDVKKIPNMMFIILIAKIQVKCKKKEKQSITPFLHFSLGQQGSNCSSGEG